MKVKVRNLFIPVSSVLALGIFAFASASDPSSAVLPVSPAPVSFGELVRIGAPSYTPISIVKVAPSPSPPSLRLAGAATPVPKAPVAPRLMADPTPIGTEVEFSMISPVPPPPEGQEETPLNVIITIFSFDNFITANTSIAFTWDAGGGDARIKAWPNTIIKQKTYSMMSGQETRFKITIPVDQTPFGSLYNRLFLMTASGTKDGVTYKGITALQTPPAP